MFAFKQKITFETFFQAKQNKKYKAKLNKNTIFFFWIFLFFFIFSKNQTEKFCNIREFREYKNFEKLKNNRIIGKKNKAGEIIYRVELPDMEQITLIYLENNDADYRKSSNEEVFRWQSERSSSFFLLIIIFFFGKFLLVVVNLR